MLVVVVVSWTMGVRDATRGCELVLVVGGEGEEDDGSLQSSGADGEVRNGGAV